MKQQYFTIFLWVMAIFHLNAGNLTWTGNGTPHQLFDKANWKDEISQNPPVAFISGVPIDANITINGDFSIGTDREITGVLSAGDGDILLKKCNLRTDYVTVTALTSNQTIEIDNANVMIGRIDAKQINIKGKSELHLYEEFDVIGANTVINLEDDDAWLFLLSVYPAKAHDFLKNIRIKGEPFSSKNARIAPYYGGTVIIPHAKESYEALTFFEEENQMNKKKAYKGDGAVQTGVFKIPAAKSIRLKRGYMLLLSETSGGGGHSYSYIADDHDIEINLSINNGSDDKYLFLRVSQWNWVSKRGFCWGNYIDEMNVSWYYNWSATRNKSTNSTNNSQSYVPMRHGASWPNLDAVTAQADFTHLLGFNEPERIDQANMTVNQALDQWPALQSKGMLLGSPCPANTATGKKWLIAFMDSCIVRGYRVDFITLHNYEKMSADYFINTWCKFWYDKYKIPVWVTEFNYGANWNSQGLTGASNDNAYHAGFRAYVEALDAAPFIGRYAYYHFNASTEYPSKLYNGFESYSPSVPSRNGIFYREYDSRPERGNPILYRKIIMDAKKNSAISPLPQNPFDGRCIGLLSRNTDGTQRRKIAISTSKESINQAIMGAGITSSLPEQEFWFEYQSNGSYKLHTHLGLLLSFRNDSILALPDENNAAQTWVVDSIPDSKFIALRNMENQQYLYPRAGKINKDTPLTTRFDKNSIVTANKAHWEVIYGTTCSGAPDGGAVEISLSATTGTAPLTVRMNGNLKTVMGKDAYYVWNATISDGSIFHSTRFTDEVTFDTPGVYTLNVRIRDYYNIDKIFQYQITVTENTALSSVQSKSNWTIHPNPVKDKVYITGLKNGTKIKILNLQGILQQETIYMGSPISVEELSQGIYLMVTSTEGAKCVVKQK